MLQHRRQGSILNFYFLWNEVVTNGSVLFFKALREAIFLSLENILLEDERATEARRQGSWNHRGKSWSEFPWRLADSWLSLGVKGLRLASVRKQWGNRNSQKKEKQTNKWKTKLDLPTQALNSKAATVSSSIILFTVPDFRLENSMWCTLDFLSLISVLTTYNYF